MKKIILNDASSCCSECFEELDPGTTVYIDENDDIICEECFKENYPITQKKDEPDIESFKKALQAINEGKTVKCTCSGTPVVYKVINDELTINGNIYDIRNFCFAPTQILYGIWEIED
jgi:hypothetical protein